MNRLPLLLGMLALAAPASAQEDEAIRDKKSGLIVQMPEGWSRETGREKGSVKFAAIFDLSKTKYILFSVETAQKPNRLSSSIRRYMSASARSWFVALTGAVPSADDIGVPPC